MSSTPDNGNFKKPEGVMPKPWTPEGKRLADGRALMWHEAKRRGFTEESFDMFATEHLGKPFLSLTNDELLVLVEHLVDIPYKTTRHRVVESFPKLAPPPAPVESGIVERLMSAVARDDSVFLTRDVPAREVSTHGVVFECDATDVDLHHRNFEFMRRQAEEMMQAIPVIEELDGTLFAFDDLNRISLYHRFAPDAIVRCLVLDGDDETD